MGHCASRLTARAQQYTQQRNYIYHLKQMINDAYLAKEWAKVSQLVAAWEEAKALHHTTFGMLSAL